MATNQNEEIRQDNAPRSENTHNRENTGTDQGSSMRTDDMDAGNPQTFEVYNSGSNGMGINPNNSDMLWHNATDSKSTRKKADEDELTD